MEQETPVVTWEPPRDGGTAVAGSGAARPRVATSTPARIAAALIALVTLDYVIDGALSLQGIGLLNDLEHTTEAQLVAFDQNVATVALIGLGLFIAAGIAFLFWERRVFVNIRAVAGERVTTPNMAVIWWFVPFANFVKVPQVMQEARDEVWDGLRSPGWTPVVGWWAAYVLANALSTIYGRLPAATTVDAFVGQQGLNVAADVVYVIAAILIIRIILDIERGARAQLARPNAGPESPEAAAGTMPMPETVDA